jgi:hypothetical protein
MNNFDKTIGLITKANTALAFSDPMSRIIASNQLWANKLDSLTMSDAILKGLGMNQRLEKSFAGLDVLSRSMRVPNIGLPPRILDSLVNITSQQRILFGHSRDLIGLTNQNTAFSKINSLQIALSGVSAKMAAIAAKTDWNLLEEFESFNEETIELVNTFTDDAVLTEDQSQRFQNLIERILSSYHKNKKYGKYALIFMSVMINLMAIHQYYDFIKDKPEPLTKDDFLVFEKNIRVEISNKLKEQNEFRRTSRFTKVMLKPKFKTIILVTLPADFDVIVLQIRHKWAYISYTNPKDGMQETGWILKKYLTKNN